MQIYILVASGGT